MLDDREQFFAKIGWEGGVYGALEYGLKADESFYPELPSRMRMDWENIRAKFVDLDEDVAEFIHDWEPEYL